ncbi:MAG TPA: hypothetical protein VGR81_12910 [Candidatus Acidoferrales bacterium]|nr:hypothetical protein [Candidatus Acidoferrales bacterium]
MGDAQKTRERALEAAVSRAVRDNLLPLQKTLEDLQQAFADLVSACSSVRPTNTLPAMLRVRATSASLAASLSVLSDFISNAMKDHGRDIDDEESGDDAPTVAVAEAPAPRQQKLPPPEIPVPTAHAPVTEAEEEPAAEIEATVEEDVASEPVEAPEPEPVAFRIADLPPDEQELHKRANRVAKVSMQDIKMLKPADVRKGQEHKDICVRLRGELDKARREYDRRFQKILEQPVDYFRHWMVEILGDGDPETLGEYPYPSPVLRR